jgi:hypothetical protein
MHVLRQRGNWLILQPSTRGAPGRGQGSVMASNRSPEDVSITFSFARTRALRRQVQIGLAQCVEQTVAQVL